MNLFRRIFSKKKKKEEQEQKKRSNFDPDKVPGGVPKKGRDTIKPAYIDSLTIEKDEVKTDEKFQVQVSGMFNDLGYSLEKKLVDISGSDIIITILARKKAGTLAGMATKPFQTTVEVQVEKKGTYTLKPKKGKAKPVEIKVK